MSVPPAYAEILDLNKDLTEAKTKTSRRAAAAKLLDCISDPKKKRKLLREINKTSTTFLDVKEKYVNLWRLIIKTVVHSSSASIGTPSSSSSSKSRSRKTKSSSSRATKSAALLDPNDVLLPYHMLKNCDTSDATTTTGIDIERTNLTAKEVAMLLTYSLEMIGNYSLFSKKGGDDNARSSVSMDEGTTREMFGMLNHLCSHTAYVALMRMPNIQNILHEMERTLSPSILYSDVNNVRQRNHVDSLLIDAAKIQSHLIQKCVQLGVGMHSLMHPCFRVVVKWCVAALKQESSGCEVGTSSACGINEMLLPYMYSVVTNLVAAHPEQSVGVMTKYSHLLFRYAKIVWMKRTFQHRGELLDYFSVQILSAEAAGKLEGLLPGDIGNLGHGSVDSEKLNFLHTVVCSTDAMQSSASSSSSSASSKGRRGGVGKKSDMLRWRKVPARLKRHLELSARVLRLSQQNYLSSTVTTDASHQCIEDGTNNVDNPLHDFLTEDTRESISCNSHMHDSPWKLMTKKQLCESSLWIDDTSTFRASQTQSTSEADGSHSPCKSLKTKQDKISTSARVDFSSSLTFLHIVCASAELYPRGDCWSTELNGMSPILNHDVLVLEGMVHRIEPGQCVPSNCSFLDLSNLIHQVTHILVSCGSPDGGNFEVQVWSLVALLKLTVPTAFMLRNQELRKEFNSQNNIQSADPEPLSTVWKNAWSSLLRPDLVYFSYSKNAEPGAIGELFILLLTEIVNCRCCQGSNLNSNLPTNDDFVYANQYQLWSLPIFKNVNSLNLPVLFELVSVVITNVGLSDEGLDYIDGNYSDFTEMFGDFTGIVDGLSEQTVVAVEKGRRYKLLCFCLRYMKANAGEDVRANMRQRLASASACLLKLIGDNSGICSTTFCRESLLRFSCTMDAFLASEIADAKSEPRITAFDSLYTKSYVAPICHLVNLLWFDVTEFTRQSRGMDDNEYIWRRTNKCGPRLHIIDVASLHARRIAYDNPVNRNSHDGGTGQKDFVSNELCEILRSCSIQYLRNIIERKEPGDGDNIDEGKESVTKLPLLSEMCLLTCIVGAAVSNRKASKVVDIDEISQLFSSILDDVICSFLHLPEDDEKFVDIAMCIYGIFRVFDMFNVENVTLPPYVRDKARQIFEKCSAVLREYPYRPIESNKRSFSPSSKAAFSDSEDDNPNVNATTGKRNRKNAVDSDESSEDHFPISTTAKRRKGANGKGVTNRRGFGFTTAAKPKVIAPGALGAKLCAAIMALLDPSQECCVMIMDALVWPHDSDYFEQRGEAVLYEPEPEHVSYCIQLFSGKATLLRSCRLRRYYANDNMEKLGTSLTVAMLCMDAIRVMRSILSPSSPYYMFGFQTSVSILCTMENQLSNDDCTEIIDHVLCPNDKKSQRCFESHPILRLEQLKAANTALMSGGKRFLDILLRFFSTMLVEPALFDIDYKVRQEAVRSIGFSLRVLQGLQQSIVDTAKGSLSLFNEPGESIESVEEKFRSWMNGNGVDDELETIARLDSRVSFEATAIECLGVIAGFTSDDNIARESTFKIMSHAIDMPNRETMCFQALRLSAYRRGYSSFNDMLQDECAYILNCCITSGISLHKLPILFCSPSVLWKLMKLNMTSALRVSNDEIQADSSSHEDDTTDDEGAHMPTSVRRQRLINEHESDVVNPLKTCKRILNIIDLYEDVLFTFCLSVADTIVPVILLHLNTENGLTGIKIGSKKTPQDIQSRVKKSLAWPYLEEMTYILNLSLDKIIKKHVASIYAWFMPIEMASRRKSKSTEDLCHLPNGVFALIESVLPEEKLKRLQEKVAPDVIIKVLQGISRPNVSLVDVSPLDSIQSTTYVIEHLKHAKVTSRKVGFEDAGSSTTECIIYAKQWLWTATLRSQKDHSWDLMSLLFDEIVSKVRTKSVTMQLEFCLTTLMSCVLNAQFRSYRLKMLVKLASILDAITDSVKDVNDNGQVLAEVVPCINLITAGLMQLHEEAQRNILANIIARKRDDVYNIRSSVGIFQRPEKNLDDNVDNGGDFQGWIQLPADITFVESVNSVDDLKEALNSVDTKEPREIMAKTFDLLNIILNRLPISHDILDPFSVTFKFDEEKKMLRRIDAKFCLEDLVSAVEASSMRSNVSFPVEIERFISVTERHMVQTTDGNGSPSLFHWNSLLISFEHLSTILRSNHKEICKKLEEVSSHPLLHRLITQLAAYCQTSFPEDVRLSASRCLGELGSIDWTALTPYHVTSIEVSREATDTDEDMDDDPLIPTKIRALKLLCRYLCSDDAEKAIVAMKTIKAILSTEEGLKCLKRMNDERVGRLLEPFRSEKRVPCPTMRENFMNSLLSIVSIDRHNTKKDTSWCWSDYIWTHPANSKASFESWIRNLVCSIIHCCYVESSNGPDYTISGHDDFFVMCAAMSSLEHDFASTIFPGLVFDLLQEDKYAVQKETNKNSGRNVKKSVRDFVNEDTMIGSRSGSANIVLTNCFRRHLIGSVLEDDLAGIDTLRQKKGSFASPKATVIALDTLDLLRNETQRRFLRSNCHERNPNVNKGSRNTTLWRGVPFGVVLQLDGLNVAAACLRVKRFASGLFYANLFADNRFGGSGECLRVIASQMSEDKERTCVSRHDISGYGVEYVSEDNTNELAAVTDAKHAMKLVEILRSCFLGLQEADAAKGIEADAPAIFFSQNISNVNIASVMTSSSGNRVHHLAALDTRLQSYLRPGNIEHISDHLSVAKCLENMGMQHILRQYLVGIHNAENSPNSSFSQYQRDLREYWFKNTWKVFQWDDTILAHDDKSIALTQGVLSQAANRSGVIQADKLAANSLLNRSSALAGFHESLDNLFRCMAKDDIDGTSIFLHSGRNAMISSATEYLGGESMIRCIPAFATNLQILNELEDVSSALHSNERRKSIQNYFAQRVNESEYARNANYGIPFDIEESLFSCREIAHKLLIRGCKDSASDSSLISHLWGFCRASRHQGRPDIAESVLLRLSRLLRGEYSSSISTIELMVEEAKIMKSRNDLNNAIRAAKIAVNHIKREAGNKVDNSTMLLSKALLTCGKWMTEAKVESAHVIKENFLRPAALTAKKFHEKYDSSVSAKHLADAHLAMGEFVSNLYDGATARVSSPEWKSEGLALDGRVEELNEAKKMQNDLSAEIKRVSQTSSSDRRRSRGSRNSNEDTATNLLMQQRNLQIHVRELEKEINADIKERQAVEESIREFLTLALNSYITALSYSPVGEEASINAPVFRTVSLWFGSQTSKFKYEVNRIIDDGVLGIPSFRFVPLTYQLFARIDGASAADRVDSQGSNGEDIFQAALRKIVKRICIDHPYHGIVQLIALANGNNVGEEGAMRNSSEFLDNVGNSKVIAAEGILKELRKEKSYVSKLVDSYQTLTSSYIELAMFPTKNMLKANPKKTKGYPLSSAYSNGGGGRSKGSIPSLDRCFAKIKSGRGQSSLSCPTCILTKPPKIRPGADYGGGKEDPIGAERISSFRPTFDVTETGIHRPKIVICEGTKGGKYKQLVKGEDDIRQDAIMEQVFTTVNALLRQRGTSNNVHGAEAKHGDSIENSALSSAASRQLRIATYNIVPLSPASGVLEWVDDTAPFGDYLSDKKKVPGAHSKYYPGEWGSLFCRKLLVDEKKNKRTVFDKICKNFSPCFRYFFIENFSHDIQAWHAAKMLYTRSCAVNSIVGHVLGIGDRHTHNILIHQKTGEVVHIDFGIVFEQGKSLPTPETVPFRLTRDIVDGMGPTGVEGAFTTAAEATAKVLRENSSSLLTILSAVVADPLYKWSVSPVKARQRQVASRGDEDEEQVEGTIIFGNGSSLTKTSDDADLQVENKNEGASRALKKIERKLQGYEDGISTGEIKSVEGQVQLLINAARDADNLCVLFPGWAPWI